MSSYGAPRVAQALARVALECGRDCATPFSRPVKLLGERDTGDLTDVLQRYLQTPETASAVRRFCEDIALDVMERLVCHADQGLDVNGLIFTIGAKTADQERREIDVRGLHDEIVILRSKHDNA